MSEQSLEKLREIDREIASAIIITSDGKFLFGRKKPEEGGVYSEYWHIPGGGVNDGESLIDAVIREVHEETGIDIPADKLTRIPLDGSGTAIKTLKSGERVLCHMRFNRFEARLPLTSGELLAAIKPGDDLIDFHCFSESELTDIKQIPGGYEFFVEAGYIAAPENQDSEQSK